MIKIIKETHECVQGGGSFQTCIFLKDGERFFSTEDVQYLKKSIDLLDDETISLSLEWDRNSMELPQLGPNMDIDIFSPLFIRRSKEELIFEVYDLEQSKKIFHKIYFSDWVKVVTRLK